MGDVQWSHYVRVLKVDREFNERVIDVAGPSRHEGLRFWTFLQQAYQTGGVASISKCSSIRLEYFRGSAHFLFRNMICLLLGKSLPLVD